MARIRTFKPEFWTDSKVVTLTPFARLLFLGSWNFALCDDGHLPDDPMALKLQVLPADAVDPFELLQELLDAGVIVAGETSDGRRFLHIRRLRNHQKVDNRWTPRCFVCADQKPAGTHPSSTELPETRASLDETRRDSPKLPETRPGMERNGKEGSTTGARKRGTRLPDDFTPTEELRAWARDRGFNDAQIGEMTDRFVDHWCSATGSNATKADWNRAWRNWVGKEDPRRVRGTVTPIRQAAGGQRHTFADGTPMPWDR